MRTGLLILYVSLLIAGCKSRDPIPNNVLPQKEMQVVVWDMMRVDQFLTDYVLPKDSSLNRRTESIKLYQQVFTIHKISKEEFQRSFSFYRSHPALLKVIMDSLSKLSTAAPTEIIKPQLITDSVQPVKKFMPVRDVVRPSKRIKPAPLN